MNFLTSVSKDIYYLWSIVIGLSSVVFGAGMLVEKVKKDRNLDMFVTKEVHAANLKTVDEKFNTITVQLSDIKTSVNKITDWIDQVRQP